MKISEPNSYNKRVLFLSPFPPPYGGIATLTKILCEKGLPAPYFAEVLDTKLSVMKFKSSLLSLLNEVFRAFKILIKLFFHLLFKRPSIVHLNCSLSPKGIHRDLFCILLSRIFGVPTLTHYHGNLGDFNINEKYTLSKYALKYLIYFNSINIYSNIPSLNFSMNKLGLNLDLKRNYIIPNYSSDKVWDFEHKAEEKKVLTCGFVGNLTRAKGVDLIVELAKKSSQFNFELVGNIGTDLIDQLTKNLPENVKLHGALGQAEIFHFLENIDIFIFPSLTEGFPLSMVEAMSIGLPVVCTNVGSLPEMIDDRKGGFILEVGNIEQFEKSLLSLTNFEFRKSAGEYNRSKAKNEYRFDVVAMHLIKSYNKIL